MTIQQFHAMIHVPLPTSTDGQRLRQLSRSFTENAADILLMEPGFQSWGIWRAFETDD